MAMAAAVAPMIGAVGSVVGGAMANSASQSEAAGHRNVAAWNAARIREEANWQQSKGAMDSQRKRDEGRQAEAKARAQIGESGSVTDTGTPLDLMTEFAAETKYQSDVVMADALNKERDLKNRAKSEIYEGELRARSAENKGKAALLGGITGAVSGVGKAAAGGFG